ncbi:hypothetical protein [Bradyrhizobium ottawaense]|uniref:hypothetical protein n=1 Tax=Bradyrhizobium ottawaense TaxID=931866 RepID=UPI0030F44FEF
MSDAIRLKVLPKFPAKLTGRAGIDVTKQNGEYFLDLDYSDFPQIGAVPAGTIYALIFDPATAQYSQLPISLLGDAATPLTVATLPSPTRGLRRFVSDATAATFGSVVAGGGANAVPVYATGTDWRIG